MRPRELYLTVRGILALKDTELESRERIARPLSRRLWLYRRGFLSRSDVLYELDETSAGDYVSDYQRFVRTRLINGTWAFALKNKLMFHWLMEPFDAHRMAVHGLLRDGSVHSIEGAKPARSVVAAHGGSGRSMDVREDQPRDLGRVIDRLEEETTLVLKWIYGGGGHNVLICAFEDGQYLVNGERHDRRSLEERIGTLQDYLVCEFVEQSTFSAELFPETPNTIRMLTMYDEDAGEAYVPAAVHRIGTERSRPMDNFLQGGLSAHIDLDTGQLGRAAQLPYGGTLEWHAKHPDTGAQIEGTRIPRWSAITQRVREMAEMHAYLPYVGWDLVLTEDRGEFTVIEANSYPGLHSIQVHVPLLADDRARAFYRGHDVI